ncbi:MAG TPA: sugar transporter [Gammaproteobacteria bacterium]|nr:sugar transporter [Gammaproteobacteria bacterium]
MSSKMKNIQLLSCSSLLTIGLLIFFAFSMELQAETVQPSSTQVRVENPYLIHPGDILQISVWKEEDLQREVLVLPDGSISFPLVGQVVASGLSIEALQGSLAEALRQYIPDPVITVSATQLLGNRIYVLGQVNKPGEYLINRPVDVMQALSMSGGLTAFGAANKVKVLRRNGDKQIVFPFKYKEVTEGENLYQNILLKAGDVVIVP